MKLPTKKTSRLNEYINRLVLKNIGYCRAFATDNISNCPVIAC